MSQVLAQQEIDVDRSDNPNRSRRVLVNTVDADNQVQLAPTAAQRRGVQPVVALTARRLPSAITRRTKRCLATV